MDGRNVMGRRKKCGGRNVMGGRESMMRGQKYDE